MKELLDHHLVMPEPNSGCWIWIGCRNRKGYGQMTYENKPAAPHRLSWELSRGPIPDGLWVLHKCDVPSCCNPDHLYLGTHNDNMRDVRVRHRMKRKGELAGKVKLSEEDVHAIRAARARGASYPALALLYGITKGAIRHAAVGINWSHI